MTTTTAQRSPLNSPFESGLRSLVILSEAYPTRFDLQRLVMYDYLVVHSGDLDGSPESLHPATPHRSGEYVVRREVIERGLLLFLSRGLLERHFDAEGITYTVSDMAPTFLDALNARYTNAMRERAEWVVSTFKMASEVELQRLFTANLGRWGGEFGFEAILREEAL